MSVKNGGNIIEHVQNTDEVTFAIHKGQQKHPIISFSELEYHHN
jgi:hypothetical protein